MALNTDIAFKFGCGRYIQEKGAIKNNLLTEVKRFGNSVLFICGKNGCRVAKDSIESALTDTNVRYEIKIFESTPCFENADEYALYAKENNYDIICGVGGGVLMDMVKLCAERADKVLFQIPTISATCAAATPISVLYDRNNFGCIGTVKLMKEADVVLTDLDIMINQPPRFFWAGVMDAMAKMVEISHRTYNKSEDKIPMGLEIAFEISKTVYDFYLAKKDVLTDCLAKKEITKDFEKAIFYTIAVTGVISGISKGSNQTAIAHKIYEEIRTAYYYEAKDFVHGELVAMGLIVQLAYTGLDYKKMIEMLHEMNLPVCLSDINIPADEKAMDIFEEKLCNSSSIMDTSADARKKVRQALQTIKK